MVKTITTELNEDGEWDIADDAGDDVLDDLIAQMIKPKESGESPTGRSKKKSPRALSESEQETQLLAEIMLHVFGDDAEELMFAEGPVAAFDESKIKRGSDGRFAEKGSANAFSAAKDTIAKALKGKKTPKSAEALASKLSNLTVKQLTELKKEYGIKVSGPNKAALVAKLADRLDRARRTPDDEPELILDDEEEELILDDDDEVPPDVIREVQEDFQKEQEERRNQEERKQAKQQQRETFRANLIREFDESKTQLDSIVSQRAILRQKESNLLNSIDKQNARIAKAQAKLARNPDDAKAQNELRLAEKNLAKFEPQADQLADEMRDAFNAMQSADQRNKTALTRMMSGYIDEVNSSEEAKQEAAEKLAEVKNSHQHGFQILNGITHAVWRFGAGAYEESEKVAAEQTVAQEREKGQSLLTAVANARFHARAMKTPLVYREKVRAFAQEGQFIALARYDEAKTYLHEFGHQIEYGNSRGLQAASEFFKKRTQGDQLQTFASKFPGFGYKPEEKGYKDDFAKAQKSVYGRTDEETERMAYYTGKVYSSGSTELLSMGIEMLNKNAASFAKADPEYFDLVVGILSGQMLED